MQFAFCLHYMYGVWLRFETAKVLGSGCEKCRYGGWSSSVVDITGGKEMCSVSISRSKVLPLLVADWRWKYV